MGKQKKPAVSGQQAAPVGNSGKQPDDQLAQGTLGNAMLASQVPVPDVRQASEAEFGRPLLERALFALQITPREPAQVRRFTEILSRSDLPDDRRQELVDRLTNNQETAEAIAAAVVEHFGADSEGLRSTLISALDHAWSGLENTSLAEALAAQQSVVQVPDLPVAVEGFGRAVYLLLTLDEEEEELADSLFTPELD